ncbi:MAG: DUF1343 domain-containing protein [Acidobacteriota bacterium]|nr:DUF1343 domain-containing protein [Acidobacteriota bacterium]
MTLRRRLLAAALVLLSATALSAQGTALPELDRAIQQAIAEKKLPGAVVLIGRRDEVLLRKVYGLRAVSPAPEPMTLDTIFDLASLTKPIATATAVMQQVEAGAIRLDDRVADYIPAFGKYGKDRITVRHLLTHMSGLRPDLDLGDEFEGRATAIRYALEEIPGAPPGRVFVYSDINFFLLADIVARVTGMPFERYTRERIFEPLGMRDTMFLPPAALASRIAPTEPCDRLAWPCRATAAMLRGVVHDPTARRMDGVAGHAGLFGTAEDLSRFARMLLGEPRRGTLGGTRVLSPLSVARMTSPATPESEPAVRGLGWDINSAFSSNRGDLLPLGSFGHTGFTGTSMWIDPASGLYVIFLSNRVHPDGTGDVTALRARVASIAAAAFIDTASDTARFSRTFFPVAPAPAPAPSTQHVLTGLDVLAANNFAELKGRRVGLITNHTGRSRDGATTIDLLYKAPGVTLAALFSPEHGIRGILDATVPSSVDEKTDLTIHSLYGATRRPTADMLRGLDTLVIDLQDIGARFYTYMTTMAYVMEEAAKRGIRVVVLDRPNPINGFAVEGPGLDEDERGFTGYLSMPIRHGMTMGELATLFNGEMKIGADLQVIEMRGWQRERWFDQTQLPWINPSPNMRNLNQAVLYPGIGAFEGTNISVGRGTDTPFEQVGAPWIDGPALAAALNARRLAGVSFYPVRFTPVSSKFAGEECQGVFMLVLDRAQMAPVRVGVELASALWTLHGATFEIDKAARLFGSKAGLARIKAGEDPARIAASWAAAEAAWRRVRAKYVIY